MDVLLDDEEGMIRDQARSFLESSCSPALVRVVEAGARHSPELWREIVDLGWLDTSLPEAVGGLGLPIGYLGLIFEEIGRHIAPVPFASTIVPLLILARHGGDAHRQAIDAARTGTVFCFAVQEEGGAWSADAIRLAGRRDREEIILNGTKLFVDDFGIAGHCLVAFRMTGETEGLTLALVPTDAAGLVATELVTTAKDREAAVRFEDVRIPSSAVVGEVGQGGPIIREMMDLAALFAASQLVGASRKATEMAIDYVKEREAFDQPIGAFQAIQHLVADMVIGIDGAELLSREAAWKLGRGEDAGLEISQAKAFASEKCLIAARASHQMHGGIGFMMEFDLHLWYRRVVSWSLRFGTASEHRRRIADTLFSHPDRIRLDGQRAA